VCLSVCLSVCLCLSLSVLSVQRTHARTHLQTQEIYPNGILDLRDWRTCAQCQEPVSVRWKRCPNCQHAGTVLPS
jgi:hypothetical protein